MKNFMAFDLPHACGDEPPNLADLLDTEKICPTHVGMNRLTSPTFWTRKRSAPRMWDEPRGGATVRVYAAHLPHACGDEPLRR